MVHPIFKCLVKKNFSYSKTIILTEIFLIIHILSLSNKALKYFLNYTKTFKNNVTSNAYSLWPTDTISISWECLQVDKAGVWFWKFFCNFGVFLMDSKVIKGKWHQNETPPAYSYWTKPLSWKFSKWSYIVHTTFWVPKLLEKINFFILGATLDLPIINMKNQNKPNVCWSLVLQVYFQKKVLWIVAFYLFGLYNNNNFGLTH